MVVEVVVVEVVDVEVVVVEVVVVEVVVVEVVVVVVVGLLSSGTVYISTFPAPVPPMPILHVCTPLLSQIMKLSQLSRPSLLQRIAQDPSVDIFLSLLTHCKNFEVLRSFY